MILYLKSNCKTIAAALIVLLCLVFCAIAPFVLFRLSDKQLLSTAFPVQLEIKNIGLSDEEFAIVSKLYQLFSQESTESNKVDTEVVLSEANRLIEANVLPQKQKQYLLDCMNRQDHFIIVVTDDDGLLKISSKNAASATVRYMKDTQKIVYILVEGKDNIVDNEEQAQAVLSHYAEYLGLGGIDDWTYSNYCLSSKKAQLLLKLSKAKFELSILPN